MRRSALILVALVTMLASLALPAAADHTDPNAPLTLNKSTEPLYGGEPSVVPTSSRGNWEHLWAFPGHEASDITFFNKGGNLYSAQGTLGQGLPNTFYVGQRITQLMEGNEVLDPPVFRADHGSAACGIDFANTGLQHDSYATPPSDPEVLIDTSDSIGRCHDTPGGGIELIDISGLDDPAFEPRELHLLRFNAWTHTSTLDPKRPWIIWNNNSDGTGTNFLDFADIRTCLSVSGGGTIPDSITDIDQKRDRCRPEVYRIPFEDEWTQQTIDGEQEPQGTPAMCHDIVIEDDIVHCSGLSSEVLLDISDLTDPNTKKPLGTPLPCKREDGTSTGAKVTDCSLGTPTTRGAAAHKAWEDVDSPQATGWDYLGHFNHPGRTHAPSNSNLNVPADEGIAVSHESRPFPAAATGDQRFMLVSDERGGGVVPGGASCTDDNFDVYGHGGLHVFDITDPSNIDHAKMLDADGNEQQAFWRTENIFPQPTFCVVHRFRFLPGEQRIVMGYYTQGVRILDYEIDEDGYFSFEEVGSYAFKDSNTWTGDVFHTVDNADGTRSYYIAASDTIGSPSRGLDILEWRAAPNPIREPGTAPPVTIGRQAGENRYETAVEVSRARFNSSDTVFVARGDVYADALAGGPLAAAEGAPMLLTHVNQLTDVTEREVQRLGASRAVLLGGEQAVGAEVAARLEELGLTVERVAGPNRWATAAAVAVELGDDSGTVFLTEGDHAEEHRGWPDALSAAPYAAFAGQPILLTHHGILPDETRKALTDAGADETIVVGGRNAVSDEVVAEVERAGHGPRRLAGGNRYETSAAVYNEAMDEAGMAADILWIATGNNWPDALTAGGVAGAAGQMLILVDGTTLDNSPATRDLIAERRTEIRHVNILGGVKAISEQVQAELRALFDAEDDETAAAAAGAPGSRGPLGSMPVPMTQEVLLLLLAGLLLPAAALFGRRRQARLLA